MSENTNINKIKVFSKGDIIFHEGQPSDHFYILQKGEVEVSIRKNEKRVVIGTLGPGEFFGEMGLLSSEPRSASCRALAYVEVARISNDDFKKTLKNSHPLVGKIINVLLRRLRRSNVLAASQGASANFFYAVATMLDLNFRAANSDSISEGLFIKQLTATLGILPHQAKDILQRFAGFGLIQIQRQQKGPAPARADDMSQLLLVSSNLLADARIIQDQEPDKTLPDSLSSELEFMEIKDALEFYDIDQEKFYRRLSATDFPEHLFFINKSVLSNLLKAKGKPFFEGAGG
jgi:CRP-like cAMP-binding protein